MRSKCVWFFLVMTLTVCSDCRAAVVLSRFGNIYYEADDGTFRKLTGLGKDDLPALHPGGEWVYFARRIDAPCSGAANEDNTLKGRIRRWMDDSRHTEWQESDITAHLMRIRTDGTGIQKLYAVPPQNTKPGENGWCGDISEITFSPDGALVYLETSKRLRDNLIVSMRMDGSRVRELGSGCGLRVIKGDEYDGHLIVMRHCYFWFSGSYDWFYLFTPDLKKQIGVIGDSMRNQVEIMPTHRIDPPPEPDPPMVPDASGDEAESDTDKDVDVAK